VGRGVGRICFGRGLWRGCWGWVVGRRRGSGGEIVVGGVQCADGFVQVVGWPKVGAWLESWGRIRLWSVVSVVCGGGGHDRAARRVLV
jgi:hypothetical protein